jgi:hypothetical protein
MKKSINKIKYLVLATLLLFQSCSDFLDVNDDPNSLKEANEKILLPYGIGSLSYLLGGRYQVLGALWSQHWTQSLGGSQYKGIDSYNINSSTYDGEFREMYAGALMNFEEIRKISSQNGNWHYYLIATVLQSYGFQVLADLYGEIPFSEAFQGNNGLIDPGYEDSRNIYDSLIARMDFALAQDYENEDLDDIGIEDLMFKGDMDRWVEFANTLKLKIYIRQSGARPEVARAGIEKLYEDEDDVDFLETDAVFWLYEDVTGKRNPLYETEIFFLGNNTNLVLSNTLYYYMNKNGDFDRLNKMFNTPARGGAHKGLGQGNFNDPDEPSGTNSANYSKPVLLPDYPVFLMSLPEIYLLQAEAMVRFGVGGYDDAKKIYETAVDAAFKRYGLTNAKSFYTAGGAYEFPSEGAELEKYIEKIIVQKWLALVNFQGLETFFEHNRTLYPLEAGVNYDNEESDTVKFTVSVNNVTSGRFPRRLMFPESEYSANPENTPEQKPVFEKLWWHKQ